MTRNSTVQECADVRWQTDSEDVFCFAPRNIHASLWMADRITSAVGGYCDRDEADATAGREPGSRRGLLLPMVMTPFV
jgi:hypothetical protein